MKPQLKIKAVILSKAKDLIKINVVILSKAKDLLLLFWPPSKHHPRTIQSPAPAASRRDDVKIVIHDPWAHNHA